MVFPPAAYVALDAVSAALTLVVAYFFLRLWRAGRDPIHALFAIGFAVIGVTFLTVTPSNLDLVARRDAVDAARLAGQLSGALILAFAYVSNHHHGRARVLGSLGAAAAATLAIVAVVAWVVPPRGSVKEMFPIGFVGMIAAYATCLGFSLESVLRRPSPDRLLVPGAFLAWALTKYTWLLIEFTGARELALFVYVWRFAAIALLLLALRLPAHRPGVVPDAAP